MSLSDPDWYRLGLAFGHRTDCDKRPHDDNGQPMPRAPLPDEASDVGRVSTHRGNHCEALEWWLGEGTPSRPQRGESEPPWALTCVEPKSR